MEDVERFMVHGAAQPSPRTMLLPEAVWMSVVYAVPETTWKSVIHAAAAVISKGASFAVVLMTANSKLRMRDIEGLCDNLSFLLSWQKNKKSKTTTDRKLVKRVVKTVTKILKYSSSQSWLSARAGEGLDCL